MRPKMESRNSGDHELWNHEMRGFPVVLEYYIENSGGLAVNTAMQFTMQLKCIGTYINVGICVLSGA